MTPSIRCLGSCVKLLVLVGGLCTVIGAGAAPPVEDANTSPTQLVDALHSAFGTHHARAVHAKGFMLEGTFTPTQEARSLSAARLFDQSATVLVRFSDFTGIPDIPDTADGANPRGLAIKFRVSDGSFVDVVTHSFNGFPVRTSAEFAVLLRAIGASGPGAAKPTPLDRFLEAHPIARQFLTSQKPAPVSYGTLAYFGVNAFRFTNSAGKKTAVRYRFVPRAGEQFLDKQAVAGKSPNYLQDEIGARVSAGGIDFDWYAQVAAAGDDVTDPSVPWPEARSLVKLGTIHITHLVPDANAVDKATMFLPGNVPVGIEPADPMIAMRTSSYPISFGLRQ